MVKLIKLFKTMSRRSKILIVIILVLVALILFYWLFLRSKLTPQTGGTPKTNVNVVTLPPPTLPNSTTVSAIVPEASREDKLRSDISRLAAAFAERFGSYSNQGSFENLLDLKTLMTEKMQAWADDFIKQSKAAVGDTSVYSGVTTKAISVSITELDEVAGTANITVGTQRRKSSGNMADSSEIDYQNLELVFVRVNNEWKVDAAAWK